MIVLDTCVVSELTRPRPEPRVIDWLRTHRGTSLCLSAITLGELQRGLALLDDGGRRREIGGWLEALREHYRDRILPVDERVAVRWGEISAGCRRAGRPLAALDGLIAATAAEHGCSVATRNTADFEAAGIALINPWLEGAADRERVTL